MGVCLGDVQMNKWRKEQVKPDSSRSVRTMVLAQADIRYDADAEEARARAPNDRPGCGCLQSKRG